MVAVGLQSSARSAQLVAGARGEKGCGPAFCFGGRSGGADVRRRFGRRRQGAEVETEVEMHAFVVGSAAAVVGDRGADRGGDAGVRRRLGRRRQEKEVETEVEVQAFVVGSAGGGRRRRWR